MNNNNKLKSNAAGKETESESDLSSASSAPPSDSQCYTVWLPELKPAEKQKKHYFSSEMNEWLLHWTEAAALNFFTCIIISPEKHP